MASQKDDSVLNALKREAAIKGGEANKARLAYTKPPLTEDPYAYLDEPREPRPVFVPRRSGGKHKNKVAP